MRLALNALQALNHHLPWYWWAHHYGQKKDYALELTFCSLHSGCYFWMNEWVHSWNEKALMFMLSLTISMSNQNSCLSETSPKTRLAENNSKCLWLLLDSTAFSQPSTPKKLKLIDAQEQWFFLKGFFAVYPYCLRSRGVQLFALVAAGHSQRTKTNS